MFTPHLDEIKYEKKKKNNIQNKIEKFNVFFNK